MSSAWLVIVGASIGIYALKAAGPLLLGGRRLPRRLLRATMLLPAALLAALVAVSTVASGKHLEVDARLAGVVAAAIALWRRANFVVVVVVAAVVTASVRALS
ncbi:MAG: AzlD domain-containing protein [Acidimicrobiia bacterium]